MQIVFEPEKFVFRSRARGVSWVEFGQPTVLRTCFTMRPIRGLFKRAVERSLR